jgi:L-ribulokinase
MNDQYVGVGLIAIFDSVRSIIVNVVNGNEMATLRFTLSRSKKDCICNASLNRVRQHPLDYVGDWEIHR